MKKINLKVILFVVILVLSISMLAACDLTSGNNNKTPTKENEDTETYEVKKDLSKLVETYNNKEVRKNDIKFNVDFEGYTRTVENAKDKMDVGFKINSEIEKLRVDGYDVFALKQKSDKEQNRITGILGGLLEGIRNNKTEDSALSILELYSIDNLIEYLIRFIDGRAETEVEIAKVDRIFNVLSVFDSTEDNSEDIIQKWYLVDNIFASDNLKSFNNNIILAISTLLFENSYENFVKSASIYTRDTAKAYLNSKGEASYDFEINTDKVVEYELKKILSMFSIDKTTLNELVDGLYDKVFEYAKKCITVEEATVKAKALDNKDVKSIDTSLAIKFAASYGDKGENDIETFINYLTEKDTENKLKLGKIRKVFQELIKYLTNKDNERNKFEISIKIDLEQVFETKVQSNELSKFDSRIFIPKEPVNGEDISTRIVVSPIDIIDEEEKLEDEEATKDDVEEIDQKNDEEIINEEASNIEETEIPEEEKDINEEERVDNVDLDNNENIESNENGDKN